MHQNVRSAVYVSIKYMLQAICRISPPLILDIFNTRYNIILPFYQTIVAAIARHYSSSVLFPKTAIALGCIAQILLSTEEFQRVKHTFAREANNSTAVFIASCFQENRNLAHIHSAKYFGTNQPHRMIKVRLFSIMI